MADEHGGRFTLPWSHSAQRILRREPASGPADWRDVLRARLFVCAGLFAVLDRLNRSAAVYLQVIEHAD